MATSASSMRLASARGLATAVAIALAGLVLTALHAQADPLSDGPPNHEAAFLRTLDSNFRAIQEEIRALREEQQALRAQLEQCGCPSAQLAATFNDRATGDSLGSGSEGPVHAARAAGEAALVGHAEDAEDFGGAMVRIDVRNTEWIKEVLFGGRPWVITCEDRRGQPRSDLPQMFLDSAEQLKSMATFGVVDCWERMSSGKTLAHRFDFPPPPVMFAVANGDPPTVINTTGVVKPWQLRRKVQSYLEVSIPRIDSPEKFKSLCINRRACLIIGFKSAAALSEAMAVVTPALDEYRGVRAVAVDTSVWIAI